MDKQQKRDYLYMRMARTWAENSYCVRRKVGALLVKDQMIISDGYNGTPSGFENICEDENNVSKPYVLHADRTTPPTAQHSTSLLRRAWSAPNSSSNPASKGSFTARNIASWTASNSSREPV